LRQYVSIADGSVRFGNTFARNPAIADEFSILLLRFPRRWDIENPQNRTAPGAG
jgi:hypothetical protein